MKTLRMRIARWMCAGAMISVVVFGAAAWVLVRNGIAAEEEELRRAGIWHEESHANEYASEQILGAMAIAGPLSLIVALGFGLVWSRRITQPLERIIGAVGKMSSADLTSRIEPPDSDDELLVLAQALNGMLERLESGFDTLERHVTEASHELRTPIAVITTQLDVALRHDRNSDQWRAIATETLEEAQRMGRLVNALLRLARADSTSTGAFVPFDVVVCAQRVVAQSQVLANINGLRLSFVGAANSTVDSVTVLGDEDAFVAALRGIIDNALRHTPHDGQVQVSALSVASSAVIQVDDSGPGIHPDDRSTIFLPYARSDRGGPRDRPGLGLGLAVAKRLVETSGGRLEVGDSPLGGARFAIEIPLAPGP